MTTVPHDAYETLPSTTEHRMLVGVIPFLCPNIESHRLNSLCGRHLV